MTNREQFKVNIEWDEYDNYELAEYIDDILRTVRDDEDCPIACIDEQGRKLLAEWLGKEL